VGPAAVAVNADGDRVAHRFAYRLDAREIAIEEFKMVSESEWRAHFVHDSAGRPSG